jgi:hypothetical protein
MPDDTAARKPGESVAEHAKKLSEHADRLRAIEKRLGIAHKADNMASEDQARGPQKVNYSRRRS